MNRQGINILKFQKVSGKISSTESEMYMTEIRCHIFAGTVQSKCRLSIITEAFWSEYMTLLLWECYIILFYSDKISKKGRLER